MRFVFLQELRRGWKGLLFWCLGMLFLIGMGAAEYSVCVGTATILPMVEMMPRFIRVIFGMDVFPVNTPIGYYACMFVWYEFIAFSHAIFLGTALLAREEREKTADFLLTKPVSRSAVVTGKLLAGAVSVGVLFLLTWAVNAAVMGGPEGYPPIRREIVLSMLGMFLTQLLFLFLGLLLSAAAKREKQASSLGILLLLLSYLLSVGVEYSNSDRLDFLSPFRYFNAPSLITDGFRPGYLVLTAVLCLLLVFFIYFLYQRRDLQG